MSGYIDELRSELVAAAERQAARRMPARPRPRRGVLALAVAAAAAVLLAVIVGRSLLSDDSRPVRPAAPAPTPQTGQLPGKPLYGGSLTAGVRYRTLNLRVPVSFVAGDGNWFVQDGSSPWFLFVERREPGEKPGGAYEDFLGGVGFGELPTTLYDPTRSGRHEVPVQGNFARFLDRHPDIVTSDPRPTRIAGHDGYVFDLRVDIHDRARLDRECTTRFEHPCIDIGPDFLLFGGARQRVAVLDSSRGPFAVTVESFSAKELERLDDPAKELLSTLQIAG